jgi:hypothetical protein
MSLRKRKQSFKAQKDFPTKGQTTVREVDDDGMIINSFIIPNKDIENVDTWVHEFSERSMMDTHGNKGGFLKRYERTGDEVHKYDVPVMHAAVSHHTESYVGGRKMAGSQFEEFLWKEGKVESVYPQVNHYRNLFNSILRIAKTAKTKNDFRVIIEQFKKIKTDAIGKVPQHMLDTVDYNIKKAEAMMVEAPT